MNGALAWFRNAVLPLGVPLAWRQLTANRGRFAAALAGAACSALLVIFQLSTYTALFDRKALRPVRGLRADLVLVSRDSVNFYRGRTFPRARLVQAADLPEVAEAAPLYSSPAVWRNPRTGIRYSAVVFGVEPGHPVFALPGVGEHLEALKQADAFLYDRGSQDLYGLAPADAPGSRGEVDGRRIRIAGTFRLGQTLATGCHLLGGTQAFFRLFPGRAPDQVDVGALRLRPGADLRATADRLARLLPADVAVFTAADYLRRERTFWRNRTPMGLVIHAMMLVALLTGAVVVYQILYTDVTEHLPEYATLKAIGLTDRFLRRQVLVEAVLLHGASFLLGCALTGLVFGLVRLGTDLPLRFSPATLGAVFLASGAICGGAGWVATRRLRSADPADAF